ncbi:MAG: DUF3667 domain-containing protein [Maricaulaceae bacterium]
MSPSVCANCGAALNGPYCAACGQSRASVNRPLGVLLGESVTDLVDLDGRFLRTLRLLILAPGRLSREYVDGRRARYTPPFRLFLVASVVFFLATASSSGVIHVQSDPEASTTGVGLYIAPESLTDETGQTACELAANSEALWAGLGRRLSCGLTRVVENTEQAEALTGPLVRQLPLVLAPALALLTALIYRGQRAYAAHLIFALHVHSGAFLWFAVTGPLNLLATEAGAVAGLGLALVHAGRALHGFFQRRWWVGALKSLLVILGYGVVFFLAAGVIVGVALYNAGAVE